MTTWSNTVKNVSTYSNSAKNSATYTNSNKSGGTDFILLEDSSYILQEDGYKIILEQSSGQTPWDTVMKS